MTIMKIINFQLFFLLSIIITTISTRDVAPLKAVEFTFDSGNDERMHVKLNKIDSHLANGNMPVYIVRGYEPNNLDPFNQIMEAIGGFSMYQNPEISSAAVLFEKENKFDGIIGMEYVINKLDYVPGEKLLHPSEKTLFPQLKQRYPIPQTKTSSRKKRDNAVINVCNLSDRSCQLHRNVAYVEILVMVDSSMIRKNILSTSSPDDYTPVVTHVLTLFNSVDMLYAKINKPRIKINIAGIIIGERPETFEFLDKNDCVETMGMKLKNNTEKIVRSLNAQCTADAVGSYIFQFRNNYEFRNSFDNVILLTGLPIHKYSAILKDEATFLKGFQGDVELYNEEEQNGMTVRVGATTGERHFANYVAIAHELGHSFSINGHDTNPTIDENGECCAFIMRSENNFCKKCLAWSPESQEILNKYFYSSASCIYMNEPRSLRSGPHKVMSAKRQCNCYGYNFSTARSLCGRIIRQTLNICNKPLKCVDKTGETVRLNYPMDGTPCGFRKVCWGRKCKKITS